MPRNEAMEPVEETNSIWYNPTPHQQVVDFYDVNPRQGTRYKIPAGGSREIPSRYDFAIQKVLCSDPACRAKQHGFCMVGHEGQVMGGMAPALIKKGQSRAAFPLDPALDPSLQEKRSLEAEAAAAALAKKTADEALLIATNKRLETEARIDATRKAEEAATAPQDAKKGK